MPLFVFYDTIDIEDKSEDNQSMVIRKSKIKVCWTDWKEQDIGRGKWIAKANDQEPGAITW